LTGRTEIQAFTKIRYSDYAAIREEFSLYELDEAATIGNKFRRRIFLQSCDPNFG
jgi:hypothetical protein